MTQPPQDRPSEEPEAPGSTPPPPPPSSEPAQQPAGSEAPPAGYQQPPSGYEQPPAVYQQPPSGYQQPPAGYQQPAGGAQQPPGAYQQQGYGAQPAYGAPQPGYPAPGHPVGERPGELLDRAVARLIDFVILAFVNGVIVSAIIIGTILGMRAGTFGFGAGDYAASVISTLLGTAIYLGYFTWFESAKGQTLGKMVMKLQVRGPSGGNPTVEQAARRNVFTAINILGLIPIIGWILAPLASLVAVIMIAVGINNDTVRRQGWHDQFAGGTTVVKTG